MKFKNEMLNGSWLEDIYVILIALKNQKCTLEQAKAKLAEKHTQFKEFGNYSGMSDKQLWDYCIENEASIIKKWETLVG